ncbi:hypothetical protein JTE90_008331 [Oedothorax gibbosus]|uniref:Fukutin-related protein n=1 Tax=Oedothorax gibbosus TaxID=931172 RepID=A0AAV6U1X6_9ARAC|nr:hypothetical protein JTE90_008331 [Oedothorax gibbosus]
MRIITWKIFMFAAFFTNILIAAVMWSYMDQQCDCLTVHRKHTSYIRTISEKHRGERTANDSLHQLSDQIAIILRDFEFFENDLPETVKSILTQIPSAKVFVIADKKPYPSIDFYDEHKNKVQLITLKSSLNAHSNFKNPFDVLDREHLFVFPDSTRLDDVSQLSQMLEYHYKDPNKIIAAPIVDSVLNCMALNISLRYWTMKYGKEADSQNCNAVEGEHVLLMTKALLLHLNFPFARPFSTSLFIQASLLKIKTSIARNIQFRRGKQLYSDPHRKWKHESLEQQRKTALYNDFGIKKVVFQPSKVEWYGCHKHTSRCFGTVIGNMPEYLFEGRWTPPCCLENLRQTARYVFGILQKCGVRYWLEGGSLLGAVRTGDIIPWDYDVDIGIYQEDVPKCEWLKNCLKQSIVDTQGFLWEKATEGDFIRVQFSETNHLHVDIFPFYSRNGTMTKNTWFKDHMQDMEFPEHFLNPLHVIKFVGVSVSVPNSYKEFLELKFGKGVIENPEYPDPNLMTFSRKTTKHFLL